MIRADQSDTTTDGSFVVTVLTLDGIEVLSERHPNLAAVLRRFADHIENSDPTHTVLWEGEIA
jgi:hypothetical protein